MKGDDEVTECCAITIPWGGKEVLKLIKLILVYRPPEPLAARQTGATPRGCGGC